jgi:hypothetical protein
MMCPNGMLAINTTHNNLNVYFVQNAYYRYDPVRESVLEDTDKVSLRGRLNLLIFNLITSLEF